MAGPRDLTRETALVEEYLNSAQPLEFLASKHVQYAKKRYALGLHTFVERLEQIRCPTDARVLDIGSGAGNWAVAQGLRQTGAGTVVGVDRMASYVHLGTRIAELLGLPAVSFHQGLAEDAASYRAADFVLANSALMFVDLDVFINVLSDFLTPRARIYGNYTAAPARLLKAAAALRDGDVKGFATAIGVLHNTAMADVGLHVAPRSFSLTAGELLALFTTYGFRHVERPTAHDWKPLPTKDGIVDFILEAPSAAPSYGADDAESLLDRGAHAAALGAIEHAETADATVQDLRARALIAMGRREQADPPPDGVASILLAVQELRDGVRSPESARAALTLGRRDDGHRRAFCAGLVEHAAGARPEAIEHFERAVAARPTWRGGWTGKLLAMADDGAPIAQVESVFGDMVGRAELGLHAGDRIL